MQIIKIKFNNTKQATCFNKSIKNNCEFIASTVQLSDSILLNCEFVENILIEKMVAFSGYTINVTEYDKRLLNKISQSTCNSEK